MSLTLKCASLIIPRYLLIPIYRATLNVDTAARTVVLDAARVECGSAEVVSGEM